MALHAYANGGTERLYKWVALNAYESGSFECLWKWGLWTPMKMVALTAYENDGGSEHI